MASDPPESTGTRGEPGERRNFTDVVSLFQPIVPAAETPVPPPPVPPVVAPATSVTPAAPPPKPVPPVRVPKETWAGAWEEQPRWRPRPSWTWALLIPFGVFAVTVDPVTVRT